MNTLSPHEFAPGLWTFEHPLKLAGMNMGTRSTVWRLPSGGLAVHSPGKFTDEQYATIDALGTGDTVHYLRIEGMPKLNEYAFYHQPSKSLILTDLCFNFVDHPQFLLRTFMRLNNAYGDLKISRPPGPHVALRVGEKASSG